MTKRRVVIDGRPGNTGEEREGRIRRQTPQVEHRGKREWCEAPSCGEPTEHLYPAELNGRTIKVCAACASRLATARSSQEDSRQHGDAELREAMRNDTSDRKW